MSVFILDNGVWYHSYPVMDNDGNEKIVDDVVLITNVPTVRLVQEWEGLVNELSSKEVELLKLKEYIQSESFHLETTVDFKELYGKNNADVRKHHIKMELGDVFDRVQSLELGIGWIKSYIPLLREVIRCKSRVE